MVFILIIVILVIVSNVSQTSTGKSLIPGNKDLRLRASEALPIVHGNAILKQNEICHYCGDVLRRIVKTKTVGYSGRSSGVSLRIAKGVTYRTSGSKGVPIREDVSETHEGILNITNKRIILVGEKGFTHSINSLISIMPYPDSIELQFNSKNYILMTYDSNYIYQIIKRIINGTVNASEPKKLPSGLEYYENKADWYANK